MKLYCLVLNSKHCKIKTTAVFPLFAVMYVALSAIIDIAKNNASHLYVSVKKHSTISVYHYRT